MDFNKTKGKAAIQKTIRLPEDLIEKVEALAEDNERDFSKQVVYMLKEYIKFKEG